MNSALKKILAALGVIALLTGLFVDYVDIKNFFSEPTDISGEWYFVFRTKESTYEEYINSVTEYKMHLIQEDEVIKGDGETWKYNNELLPYNRHRPLAIEGSFKEDVIHCKYTLKGKLRETTGSFKARFKDGELVGTFSGTGADVKGEFYAKRVN